MSRNSKCDTQATTGSCHAHFTALGRWRASQRCQLKRGQIARLLDKGKFVSLDAEPEFHRSHCLFYSAVDGAAFVAVRDLLTGGVISVWPLAYQDNQPWPISEADVLKARALATGRQEPSTTQCRVHYSTSGGQRTRTVMKLCGKLDDLVKAAQDAAFQEELVRAAERQGIPRSDLFAFSLGHRTTPGERQDIKRTDS